MSKPRQVFISYSHDSQIHKDWVETLATRIKNAGIKVILDQWHLGLGADIPLFMDRSVSNSDRVLMICTDKYIEKANSPQGGVGYERIIAVAELLADLETNKFIPVVRNVTGERKTAKFLGTRLYIDFSDDCEYETNLEKLIQEIKRPKTKKKP